MSRRLVPSPEVTQRMVAPQTGDPVGDPVPMAYAFAFVDISGFTTYCQREGEHAAITLLTHFRHLTRTIAVRRGVRVAKWLGDGVMLVAADQGPMAATVGELLVRCTAAGLDTHAGLARGPVLLFEGDDYVGRPVNLAARLCDAAEKGEILSCGLGPELPEWMTPDPMTSIALSGIGVVTDVVPLRIAADVADLFGSDDGSDGSDDVAA
jgi:class 3 adenylate cyclase